MSNILDVRKLCFSYYRKPLLLKDIDFCVAEKDKVLILACEGMGKSTLLKVLSSFDETYFGQIFYNGKDVKTLSDKEKKFSLLLSEPVLISGSIKKNLDYFHEISGLKKLPDDEIKMIFDKFQLSVDLKVNVKKLSLLDKRKFAILRAYLKKPNILFLDDQFTGLTLEEASQMKKIYELLFSTDMTIIFTCGNKTLKDNGDWFGNLSVNEVLYLSQTKSFKYKSIKQFFDKHLNFDVLSFSNKYFSMQGFIIKQEGQYYFSTDDGLTLKFDRKFYEKLIMLNLIEMENENVYLCSKDESIFKDLTDSSFNKNLEYTNLWIYSAVDGERVI